MTAPPAGLARLRVTGALISPRRRRARRDRLGPTLVVAIVIAAAVAPALFLSLGN